MTLEDMVTAWLSMDDLFTSPAMRDELEESFGDETGGVILTYILTPLAMEKWSAEEFAQNSDFLLSAIYEILRSELDKIQADAKQRALLLGMKSLIQDDAELRRSFTASEALQFIQAVDKGHGFALNLLDQITGLYLGLKATAGINGTTPEKCILATHLSRVS